MKHRNTSFHIATLTRTCVSALLLVASSFLSVHAGSNSSPENNAVQEKPEGKLYNIEFEGGNLISLLKKIMASSNGNINIIWSSDIEGLGPDFPELTLQNVGEKNLYEVLGYMVRNQSNQKIVFARSGNIWSVGSDALQMIARQAPEEPKPMVNFLAIQDVLDTFPLEAITTAIQTGWELAGVANDATLKFHPDTKLLIFKGNSEAYTIVLSVIGQLRVQIPRKESEDTGVDKE